MRVCLDTNVWVAALATRGLCTDAVRVVLAEHEVVIGEVIVNELRRTLERKLKLPADRLASVELLLSQLEVLPKPAKPSSAPIRDPSDRWILATAVAGEADVLVTGDQDLSSARAKLPVRCSIPDASGISFANDARAPGRSRAIPRGCR